MKKIISIGTEDFKELIDNNYYYVDKTNLIEDVFSNKVMLYTRPRRFGKSINMSMLYYFFSNKEKNNAYLFDGMNITNNKKMMKYQNRYPVILLSFKEMKDLTFQEQKNSFSLFIFDILDKYPELLVSDKISNPRKRILEKLANREADDIELKNALKIISQALYQHYNQKVIVLIDEYDVPLQKAYLNGFYDKTADFLGTVFSSVLKTNEALEHGVLTGCLRIAKESIFTGLNNFTVRSINNQYASDLFGFTQKEVDELLSYYDLSDKKQVIKEWYDGYLFFDKEIYNPWSVLQYTLELLGNKNIPATSYWANTSDNAIVVQYIANSTYKMREEFEILMNDGTIEKVLKPELTYREMNFNTKKDMNDDIYSFLLHTGYLKCTGKVRTDGFIQYHELTIPNLEVKMIYRMQFDEWFNAYSKQFNDEFVTHLRNGNVEKAIDTLSDILENSISYYDNYESFYHGFMVGLLTGEDYNVQSNKESGNGRFDIAMVPKRKIKSCIVIECKHSLSANDLIADSKKAVKQIEENDYLNPFLKQGYNQVLGYGISFYKKQCYISKL